jgi:hypothetical protein
MKTKLFFTLSSIGIVLLLSPQSTRAQSADLPKYEVAADFTSITFTAGQNEIGLGGRFTYNLNKHVALEAAGYIFPKKCQFCAPHGGRITEGLFGVKAGKRFAKWGIFAKVRPGVLSFGDGQFDFVAITTDPILGTPIFNIKIRRLTALAADVGGVLEYYPSKRFVIRLDVGTTIIHYPSRTNNVPIFDSTMGKDVLVPFRIRGETRGSLQIMAGVGFRF